MVQLAQELVASKAVVAQTEMVEKMAKEAEAAVNVVHTAAKGLGEDCTGQRCVAAQRAKHLAIEIHFWCFT